MIIMNKDFNDKIWNVLTKSEKKRIKSLSSRLVNQIDKSTSEVDESRNEVDIAFACGRFWTLKYLFGSHNLEGSDSTECCSNGAEKPKRSLCDIIRHHEGEIFYSSTFGEMRFIGISDGQIYLHILFPDLMDDRSRYYNLDGSFFGKECSLFPNRELFIKYPGDAMKAWEEWSDAQSESEEHYHIEIDLFACVDVANEIALKIRGLLEPHNSKLSFQHKMESL